MLYWIGAICLLLVSFLVFWVFFRRDYQTKGKLSPLSLLLGILVLTLHANFPYLFLPVQWPGFPALPTNPIHTWISLSIMTMGGISTLGCMGYLSFSTTLGQGSKVLRQTGPYRWTRNPQILAYGLVVVGFASLYPSLESGGWILLYAVIAHMMVITEEEHLRYTFGDSYQAYCAQVPRYLWKTSNQDKKFRSS
jgi:protein-S-isoprenylcysteine O-methyltransferase Ste14